MNKKMPRTPLSTPLSGSARETEIRIRNIMSGPKKRPPLAFLVLMFSICLFCGNLVSCQVKEAETPDTSEPASSQQISDSSGGTEQNPPKAPDPVTPPAVDLDPAARAAYVQTLEDLFYRHTLPDGTDGGVAFNEMSDNEFTLADVDGDGREELVLLTRPDVYAGYCGYILDYRSGALTIQHTGFPSFIFYSNGAFTEDDSHAQGSWTDHFWPHALFRYLPETDSYEIAGHVDAWEKVVSDINPDALPPFPTEKDISGAGILYYITPTEDLGPDFTGYSTEAVDQSVYLEWLKPILEDAQPLALEYLSLNEENINRLK